MGQFDDVPFADSFATRPTCLAWLRGLNGINFIAKGQAVVANDSSLRPEVVVQFAIPESRTATLGGLLSGRSGRLTAQCTTAGPEHHLTTPALKRLIAVFVPETYARE